MTSNRSGIRELQIARGLITLRWASIPLIFGFSLFSLRALGMSFKIEPIYILCCLLALANVFFTLHFSLLARQMTVTHGLTTLRRLLLRVVSQVFANIRTNGLRGISGLPWVASKISAIIYLMLLESLKDLPFNPFSLKNVMHTQIASDLLVIILLNRYTGSMESPMFFLSIVPITVAGAVMGLQTGAIYSGIAAGAWLATGLLVKFQLLPHIKFYPPVYGDLSQCSGWLIANSSVIVTGLFSAAFLANRLTTVFKERIFYLNDLLYKSNTRAVASTYAAEQSSQAWMITDAEGNIEKVKVDRNNFFSAELAGHNIFKSFPELEQYGMGYVIQAVLTSSSRRVLEKIKIVSQEGTEHLFNARISCFRDCDDKQKILAIFEERTEEIFLKTRVDNLSRELSETSLSLEKTSLENRENRRSFEEMQKFANEKATEIEILTQKLKAAKGESTNQNNQISSLMTELATLKSSNDNLSAELDYKQMILDEVSELMNACSEIEGLTTLIEKRTRDLFNLDNTCLHIFRAEDNDHRRIEILDIRKASPRLLDVPRNNPDLLNPAFDEGRPVIINAQITPEKSASLAITNGPMQRLIAYVPVRHQNKILGMMMLEKYGQEDNPELLINMLSYYLKHSATAIKNAIINHEAGSKNEKLHQTITRLYNQLDSIKAMVYSSPEDEEKPFAGLMNEFSRLLPVKDAVLVRIHQDASTEVCSRIDRSRQLTLSTAESEFLEVLKSNPRNKITIDLGETDGACIAFPLMQNSRLLGAVFVYFSPETGTPEEAILDFCIKMLRDHFALFVMNEEREIWENFYRETLSA
ncbi:MAG TPA: hypothetical protein PLM07_10320 [Candidatus Rifleibacterium sp.]|nr:hypothetical protein [Candidatus Rifleibacterium sp.]HPT46284.1 hypothetical protein [Candidatus Rifleibacterium sp.]